MQDNNKKTLLFSVGFLRKWHSANTKIVNNIAIALNKIGYTCIIAGIDNENEETSVEVSENITFIRLCFKTRFEKLIGEFEEYKKTTNKSMFSFAFSHPIKAINIVLARNSNEKIQCEIYEEKIHEIYEKYNVTDIVCVSFPFLLCKQIICSKKISLNKYYYPMDPWGNNELATSDNTIKIAQEFEVFKNCNAVFAPPLLALQYKNQSEYEAYFDKINVIEFANLIETEYNETQFGFLNSEFLNIVFCGTLYDLYRNPSFVLDAIKAVACEELKIKVIFVGSNESNALKNYRDSEFFKIETIASIPMKQAFVLMKKSDILLNIGNSCSNQVPSKIFDYFSTGNAILNVQKFKDAYDETYFEKYPLAFTLHEYLPQSEQLPKLKEFLTASKEKNIKFEDVEKLMPECTPKFVAQKIKKILD